MKKGGYVLGRIGKGKAENISRTIEQNKSLESQGEKT